MNVSAAEMQTGGTLALTVWGLFQPGLASINTPDFDLAQFRQHEMLAAGGVVGVTGLIAMASNDWRVLYVGVTTTVLLIGLYEWKVRTRTAMSDLS